MLELCVLCAKPIELERTAQVRAALNNVASFVCEQCAEEVRAAVEHSTKPHVIEFRHVEHIRAVALLN